MRDNTLSMDAALADGTRLHFGEVPRDLAHVNSSDSGQDLFRDMLDLGDARLPRSPRNFQKCSAASAAIISTRWCRAMHRTHRASAGGSEGTLAFTTQGRTEAVAADPHKVLGSATSAAFTRRWMPRSIW